MVDEPRSSGGDDMGATPYELLQIALASSVAITLRMYARRQHWSLWSLEVSVDQARNHAEDSAVSATEERMIDAMEVRVRIGGDLTEAQTEQLGDLVARCPVYQTLTHTIHIAEHIEIVNSGS